MSIKFDQPRVQHQSPYTTGKSAASDRREARRYAFICPAQLMNLDGSMRISARTADLSLTGCYIDMLNPFPVGTRVLLELMKNDQRLQIGAEVTSCHTGSGMGLVFDPLKPEQVDIVVSWLDEISSPAEASFRSETPARVAEGAANANAHFATRLMQILERKGIVTRSEVNELLREFNS